MIIIRHAHICVFVIVMISSLRVLVRKIYLVVRARQCILFAVRLPLTNYVFPHIFVLLFSAVINLLDVKLFLKNN